MSLCSEFIPLAYVSWHHPVRLSCARLASGMQGNGDQLGRQDSSAMVLMSEKCQCYTGRCHCLGKHFSKRLRFPGPQREGASPWVFLSKNHWRRNSQSGTDSLILLSRMDTMDLQTQIFILFTDLDDWGKCLSTCFLFVCFLFLC